MAGTTQRGKREPARGLTLERIAEAALALVSEHGRSALSMRSLAQRLGCEAMSLYHHVDGIEGVLDAVVDRLLGSILPKGGMKGEPRKALHARARAYLDLAEAYPEAFPLVATRLWHTPGALAAVNAMVELLHRMGLGDREALRQARVLGAYLNGAGLALAAWHRGDGAADRTTKAAAASPGLAPLAGSVNRKSVRADLDAGLKQLLESIGR